MAVAVSCVSLLPGAMVTRRRPAVSVAVTLMSLQCSMVTACSCMNVVPRIRPIRPIRPTERKSQLHGAVCLRRVASKGRPSLSLYQPTSMVYHQYQLGMLAAHDSAVLRSLGQRRSQAYCRPASRAPGHLGCSASFNPHAPRGTLGAGNEHRRAQSAVHAVAVADSGPVAPRTALTSHKSTRTCKLA